MDLWTTAKPMVMLVLRRYPQLLDECYYGEDKEANFLVPLTPFLIKNKSDTCFYSAVTLIKVSKA